MGNKDCNGCRNCPLYDLGCVKFVKNAEIISLGLTLDGIKPMIRCDIE